MAQPQPGSWPTKGPKPRSPPSATATRSLGSGDPDPLPMTASSPWLLCAHVGALALCLLSPPRFADAHTEAQRGGVPLARAERGLRSRCPAAATREQPGPRGVHVERPARTTTVAPPRPRDHPLPPSPHLGPRPTSAHPALHSRSGADQSSALIRLSSVPPSKVSKAVPSPEKLRPRCPTVATAAGLRCASSTPRRQSGAPPPGEDGPAAATGTRRGARCPWPRPSQERFAEGASRAFAIMRSYPGCVSA